MQDPHTGSSKTEPRTTQEAAAAARLPAEHDVGVLLGPTGWTRVIQSLRLSRAYDFAKSDLGLKA